MHILDANVLIGAHENYYALDRVPQFWDWLLAMGEAGKLKMPYEIQQEIAISRGPLHDWICDAANVDRLVLDEAINPDLLQQVLAEGYAPDLTDSEFEKVGQDPFLVAYGLAGRGRIVVTKEVSKPSRQRANRKVPDVCKSVGVPCIRDFDMFRDLDFNTL